jgi:predicted transcriptional regulator
MSDKEKILAVIRSLPEEASIDEAIDRLYLLWKVERGLEQADEGQVTDHDEFMKELLDGQD